MIRLLRAILAGVGAASEVMCPGPNVHGYRLDDPETWRAMQETQQLCPVHKQWCAGPTCWWQQSQTSAASVTADRPAGVSARDDETAAPPVGHSTSAGPPAAEDDPAGFPPSPAGSPRFVDWATPAILDVLATHNPVEAINGVDCIGFGETHVEVAGWMEWREHVAPLIAQHLQTAWAAEQRRRADQRITRDLAAAGFKAGEHFAAGFSETATCRYCLEQIRVEGDDSEPYHIATGFNHCAPPHNTYAAPK